MGKKSKRPGRKNKEKKPTIQRKEEERNKEIMKIISKLTELNLNTEYDAIKQLYTLMNTYIKSGERIPVNIPFPELKRKIIGILATSIREQVWVKLVKN